MPSSVTLPVHLRRVVAAQGLTPTSKPPGAAQARAAQERKQFRAVMCGFVVDVLWRERK